MSLIRKPTRRDLIKMGLMVGGASLLRPGFAFGSGSDVCLGQENDAFPTSPLIGGTGIDSNGKAVGSAFTEPLSIPAVMAPTPQSVWSTWSTRPNPVTGGVQDSDGAVHQLGYSSVVYPNKTLPFPLVYQIKVQVAPYSFTSLSVLPIDRNGQPTVSFDAAGGVYPAGTLRNLPESTLYSFNGNGPGGTRINAEYGHPCLVRFENHLDDPSNPYNNLDRQDFGVTEFLTHLHNGHTAPESDGNPHYRYTELNPSGGSIFRGYQPGEWVDNLYLNWPAGGDDREIQSFFWFHDHKMDHTGANVYKGMVGLYPIYDPKKDSGDETTGYRLPGVRTNNPDGSFLVDYDIPLAFYDVVLDDGVTDHNDCHNGDTGFHPEWWGKQYFQHFPNHGFVGDIFTVNGEAYPVLEVKRRKYRFRMLDCSVSRIYEFKLMSSTGGPKSAASLGYGGTELQGQYRIPDGQQCMKWLQIATDGGLIPTPFYRDSFELWPAKRREFIVDFTKYMDGTPTTKGDVIYLTNVMKMTDGRKWNSSSRFSPDPNYKVPMLKFVIGDNAPDNSLIPSSLRSIPSFPPGDWKKELANHPVFTLGTANSSTDSEIQWGIGINNQSIQPFDPSVPLISVPKGSYGVWEIKNGGGGWVHPLHLHMEEHRVVMRNGVLVPPASAGHPDDVSKEDLVALDPSESVVICRKFRDFTGPYVAHCHNLAHEDHAMMFGWTIV